MTEPLGRGRLVRGATCRRDGGLYMRERRRHGERGSAGMRREGRSDQQDLGPAVDFSRSTSASATDAATIERTRTVFQRLSDMGYRNVEPFTLSGLSAEDYRALLDEYGLKASARHVDVGTPESPADIDQIIADNRTLGIKYFGSGSTPIFPPPIYTTEAEWVAYAEYLDEIGAVARQAGQTLMVHNHDVEFETVFGDQTVYDILMANTDPQNVAFQLDLYWAANGGGIGNPLEVIERYGNRIKLFHVKDMAAGPFPGRIEIVGEGIIDFPAIFAAAGGSTKYYVVEHDPRFGDSTFDPFEAAQKGFDYLDCVTF